MHLSKNKKGSHLNLSKSLNYLKYIYFYFVNDLIQRLSAAAGKFDIQFVETYYNNMFDLCHKKITFEQLQEIPIAFQIF